MGPAVATVTVGGGWVVLLRSAGRNGRRPEALASRIGFAVAAATAERSSFLPCHYQPSAALV